MIYKVGDLVQFWIVEINHADRAVRLDRSNHWVNEAYVELAPLPDPLAGCKEDVIDAAIVLASHGDGAEVSFQYNGETFSHYGFYTNVFKPRVAALIEAQRPPSKFAALRKAWNDLRSADNNVSNADVKLEAELVKLEVQERNNAL